jgi:hypothetical protein
MEAHTVDVMYKLMSEVRREEEKRQQRSYKSHADNSEDKHELSHTQIHKDTTLEVETAEDDRVEPGACIVKQKQTFSSKLRKDNAP